MPAPHEALIRVRANSVCGSDLHYWREGRIGAAVVSTAFTPGHQFAREIASASDKPHRLTDGTLVNRRSGPALRRILLLSAGQAAIVKLP